MPVRRQQRRGWVYPPLYESLGDFYGDVCIFCGERLPIRREATTQSNHPGLHSGCRHYVDTCRKCGAQWETYTGYLGPLWLCLYGHMWSCQLSRYRGLDPPRGSWTLSRQNPCAEIYLTPLERLTDET
jgi:hypothetical protein